MGCRSKYEIEIKSSAKRAGAKGGRRLVEERRGREKADILISPSLAAAAAIAAVAVADKFIRVSRVDFELFAIAESPLMGTAILNRISDQRRSSGISDYSLLENSARIARVDFLISVFRRCFPSAVPLVIGRLFARYCALFPSSPPLPPP